MRILIIFLLFSSFGYGQTNTYYVSFENAVHHEVQIKATFPDVKTDTLVVEMSRSSPGRYALHEFAKNIYAVKAMDSKGREIEVIRPNPYSWSITGHDGTVRLEYTLFADRGDGTYAQVDNTHAHLNTPAVFMFSESLEKRPVVVTFDFKDHPEWKVATQLKKIDKNTFFAPNLYYFFDSPIEISDFQLRQFDLNGENIRFALHHPGTEVEADEYFEKVKKIVIQEMQVYGELPEFDYNEYTFLTCYMPQASGDGMEHRNSTMITSSRSLENGGMEGNIGTVAHEFFHAWNVERIRPDGLEPFDFTEANMSGLLWFAEGFTSYYTPLTLVRAELITPEEYVESLNGTFNYVWNSPARNYNNVVEMSYQAPFVDAATSVDPVNRGNTFISYYSYGSMLGLALDLKLRQKGQNLDDFMKLMWKKYGKTEIPYDLKDLENALVEFAGKDFSEDFFENFIYKSKMPNYEGLFEQVGLKISQDCDKTYFGARLRDSEDGIFISSYPVEGSPAYKAGLDINDKILSVNSVEIKTEEDWNNSLKNLAPGDSIKIAIFRYGKEWEKEVILEADPNFVIEINQEASEEAKVARKNWLSEK